ncbi:MAG: peptidoglycan DD-metalloendopeptidase family protein [Anaerolineae bacterium]|nr:peptidoglycan DD-metalloendopeptidase family protein [Anaerolineae bacterium]
MRTWWLVCVLLALPWLTPQYVMAQPQCGFVDSVGFPVDVDTFQLMQDFAVPSYRHRGWYHTAEDWFGGRGTSYGQPVRAIAAGRVTLSSPIVWGRDGGVVILEHTFPDGSIYYSQYGHLIESDAVRFPQPYTCVAAGDILGLVGEARPAPHLHFEIRVRNADLPGPGYTERDPIEEGYRRPSQMIRNWQIWLSPAHRWHLGLLDETGPATPPISLGDESLIFLDTDRVSRLTPDGRVLWRVNLEQTAVALLDTANSVTIVYDNGHMQQVDYDGAVQQSWDIGSSFSGAPITPNNLYVLPTADGALVALSPNAHEILWRVPDIPAITNWAFEGGLLALMTTTRELIVLDLNGAILQRDRLDGSGAVAVIPSGGLLAYANGGLWQIQTARLENSTSATQGGAAFVAEDGRVFVFDNEVLSAFDNARQVVWQVLLPGVTGTTTLSLYGDVLLLITTQGNIAAVRVSDGGLCGILHIYGDERTRTWHRLGGDGVLRIAIAGQIVGLDWSTLLGVCD